MSNELESAKSAADGASCPIGADARLPAPGPAPGANSAARAGAPAEGAMLNDEEGAEPPNGKNAGGAADELDEDDELPPGAEPEDCELEQSEIHVES